MAWQYFLSQILTYFFLLKVATLCILNWPEPLYVCPDWPQTYSNPVSASQALGSLFVPYNLLNTEHCGIVYR